MSFLNSIDLERLETAFPKSLDCLVFTYFSEAMPGFLTVRYRIQSLVQRYRVAIVSNVAAAKEVMDVREEHFLNLQWKEDNFVSLLVYYSKIGKLIGRLRPRRIVFLSTFFAPMAWVCRMPFALYWNAHPIQHFPVDSLQVSNTAKRIKNKAMLSLCYLSAKRARCVMPVGEEQYFDLLSHGCSDKKTRLVPLGVQDDFLAPTILNRNKDSWSDLLKVIYTGTVRRARGRDVMLEALAIANTDKPRVHLTLVGTNAAQIAYCERKARDLAISPFLTIMGRVEGQEIPALLRSADVGICIMEDTPYYRFNPPTKLFEYFVAGLPVIVSNIRTHTRYVSDWQNGIIFEYDAQDLARKLMDLSERPNELTKMRKSAALAGREYLWSVVEPRFIEAIKLMDI